MPNEPVIVARVPRNEGLPSGPWAAVHAIMSGVVRRLTALEARPVARDGRDGVGVAHAVVDQNGSLVLTRTDGTLSNVGRVVGRDGIIDDAVIARIVNERLAEAVAALPQPTPVDVSGLTQAIDDVRAEVKARPPVSVDLSHIDAAIAELRSDVKAAAAANETMPSLVDRAVADAVTEAVAKIRVPEDGKPADMAAVEAMIAERVERAAGSVKAEVARVSAAGDKLASESRVIVAELRATVVETIATLNDAAAAQAGRVDAVLATVKDGEDADPNVAAEIAAEIAARKIAPVLDEIRTALAATPASVDMAEVEKLIDGRMERAIAALPPPTPGERGSTVLVGEGRPRSNGKPDDIYIDSSSGEIYAFRS